MKAVVYERQGSGKTLVFRDVPKPVPGDDEVLIKVHAVSLNAADYRLLGFGVMRNGWIPGADVAGVVEVAGKNISGFKPGDEVVACLSGSGFGGLAEYAVANMEKLVFKPKGISFEDAAALPIAAVTALQALRSKGGVKPGHKVLVAGAGGGVGTFAVQLAKYFGAEVTAVCSAKNAELAGSLGADHVMDYAREDFASSGSYDLILAINGDYSLPAYKSALAQGGICIMVGGKMRQLIKFMLFGRLMSTRGRKLMVLSAKVNPGDLEYIIRLVEEGGIRPGIDRRYPLSDGAEAMRYVAGGHSRGKVIINVVS